MGTFEKVVRKFFYCAGFVVCFFGVLATVAVVGKLVGTEAHFVFRLVAGL